jgi:acyl transferase domain-containing protein
MARQTLPPSLHFRRSFDGSPLEKGPFRVQTDPAPWKRRAPDRPRRAAVSAFGFGGINAHLLVEEWSPGPSAPGAAAVDTTRSSMAVSPGKDSPAVAIVGMDAHIGAIKNLDELQQAFFNGQPQFQQTASRARWKDSRSEVAALLGGETVPGNYLDSLEIELGAFGIPPNELEDILPQHLLMLGVAAGALDDANLPRRAERPRMGSVVGMAFDLEDTTAAAGMDRWFEGQLHAAADPCPHAGITGRDHCQPDRTGLPFRRPQFCPFGGRIVRAESPRRCLPGAKEP